MVVFAHGGVALDGRKGIDARTGTDDDIIFNEGAGADDDVFTNLGSRGNERCGMDLRGCHIRISPWRWMPQ